MAYHGIDAKIEVFATEEEARSGRAGLPLIQSAEQLKEAMDHIAEVTGQLATHLSTEKKTYTLAAERAGLKIVPGTLRMTESIWLRRPKSKKKRQWKKWQKRHAEKYLRVRTLDLLPAVC